MRRLSVGVPICVLQFNNEKTSTTQQKPKQSSLGNIRTVRCIIYTLYCLMFRSWKSTCGIHMFIDVWCLHFPAYVYTHVCLMFRIVFKLTWYAGKKCWNRKDTSLKSGQTWNFKTKISGPLNHRCFYQQSRSHQVPYMGVITENERVMRTKRADQHLTNLTIPMTSESHGMDNPSYKPPPIVWICWRRVCFSTSVKPPCFRNPMRIPLTFSGPNAN